MQDRGLAAYLAELVGTFILVFTICTVVVLYVATAANSQTGSDFAVVGLAHGFVLFVLIAALGGVSGGHFNPAITLAAALARRIDPVDAVVYILAQLSGGVLGALAVKGILLDEGRASHYGAPAVSSLLSGNFAGGVVEAMGTFFLVLAFCAVALNPKAVKEWAPLAIGLTLGFTLFIFGPLTGASVNPARWFGPSLIGDDLSGGDLLVYVVGPIVGSILAAGFYGLVLAERGGAPPAAPSAGPPPDLPKK